MAIENGLVVTPIDMSDVDGWVFLAEVRRQRVETCLRTHLDGLDLPPDLSRQIGEWATQLKMKAMSCAVVTREAWAALDAAGIDALVIKGIALSVQTTGYVVSRGPGDIDVWVRPDHVGAAVAVLEELGYRVGASTVRPDVPSWRGRYTRWLAFEMQMERSGTPLDLHWHLSAARHGLPTFTEAWDNRTHVDIGGTPVATLSAEHAFLHSCSHAHRDGWRWLRSLIDIDRLSRLVPHEGATASFSRAFRLSAAMAYDVTASPSLLPWISTKRSAVTRARRIASTNQAKSGWAVSGTWTLKSTWDWLSQHLQLAGDGGDMARVLSGFVLPPEFLVDAPTRRPVSLFHALSARVGKASRRITHRD